MLKMINPAGWPTMPSLSQAVEATGHQRMLFVSGQVGVGPDGKLAEGIGAQAKAAVANLATVLEAGGMTPADVVKFTIYLTDAANIDGFVAAAGASLPQPPPASTLLIVKALASPEMLIEIEAIAVK